MPQRAGSARRSGARKPCPGAPRRRTWCHRRGRQRREEPADPRAGKTDRARHAARGKQRARAAEIGVLKAWIQAALADRSKFAGRGGNRDAENRAHGQTAKSDRCCRLFSRRTMDRCGAVWLRRNPRLLNDPPGRDSSTFASRPREDAVRNLRERERRGFSAGWVVALRGGGRSGSVRRTVAVEHGRLEPGGPPCAVIAMLCWEPR